MPPVIRLSLFGAPEVRTAIGDKAHAVMAQSKHVALLAMLATSRRSAWRRDRLIGLLWPELDDERARNALSKAIHNARRTLGNDVLVGRFAEEVGLDVASWSCDLWDFEDAIERDDMAEAVALFRRGPWMEGFHVPDAAALDFWIEGERARLRRRAIDATTAMADRAEQAGDATGAVEYLRLAEEWSPFDERILRRRMTLLDRHADRGGAISAFSDFAGRLQRELEAEPSPETVALLETIRRRSNVTADGIVASHGDSANGVVAASAPSTQPTDSPGLIATEPPAAGSRRASRARLLLGGVAALLVAGATMRSASNNGAPVPLPVEDVSTDSILAARRDFRTIVLLMGPGEYRDSVLQRDAYKVIETRLATDTMFRVLGARYVIDQLRDARVAESYAVNPDTILANARFMGHAVARADVARFGGGFTVSMVLNRTDRMKPIATYTGVAKDSTALPDLLRALVDSISVVLRQASPSLQIAVNEKLYSPVAVQLFYEAHAQNNRGNFLDAVNLARAAIRIDSNFVGAWSALSGFLGNAGLNRAERLLAASKEYSLRYRSPSSSELWHTARWYVARRLYDSAYMAEKARPGGNYENFQGNLRRAQGEFAMAEREFRRMLARAPGSGLDKRNLALTLLDQGKLATADSLLREMEEQPQLRRWVLELRGSRAVALHDHEALIRNEEAVAADSANDSASRIRALERLRAAIAMTGRLHSSDSLALMLQQRRDSLRDPGSALATAAERASLLAVVGRNPALAKRVFAEATLQYSLERLAFMDRPYPALIAAHVFLDERREAKRLSDEWERDVPPLFRLVDAAAMADARGELALADGRPLDALRYFRSDRIASCAVCDNVNIARAFDALSQSDSALFYFTRYLDTPATNRLRHDMLWLAFATRRAGEIHETRAEVQQAIVRYQSFIALRANADVELSGQGADVQSRVVRLRRR